MSASDHGNSPAAWTAVTIIIVGSLITAVGFVIPSPAVAIIGVVVMIAGVVVGKMMQMAGLGKARR